ncbi:hypothetical protein EJP82_19470 [Paenibacillus anaericanus]|uniref:Uncharacterized protein n=1 Tax=Paenibacillus anaericanus TaxID=170367 RepID=A0A3S1BNK6_9BACL|nr:hypothetical protein [Paenibacillus anaericanus]RUT43722.1 hypothetical protein EJP82_19470 [Paenibacillus anaericanus]
MHQNYEKWNRAFFEHFFGEHNSHKVVYLYINESLIIMIGGKLGVSEEDAIRDFCLSVQSYTKEVNELFEIASKRGQRWFNQKAEGIPPFIAVMALTVLAAVNMRADSENGIGGGNYYVRLRELLSLEGNGNGNGMPRGFDNFQILWDILRDWQELKNGEYGFINIFEFGTKYTAYARSQCLIRETEREQLFDFFYWAGYKPGIQIDINYLINHLEAYLSSRFNRLSRMFNTNDLALKKEIAETILHEFKRWTGGTREKQAEFGYNSREVNRIKEFKLFLVLEAEGIIPKAKISFNYLADNESFINNIDDDDDDFGIEGFSYANNLFRKYIEEELLNEPISFESNDKCFRLFHEATNYFIFRKGQDLGFKGWVSRRELLAGQEHLLLFHEEMNEVIEQWIEDQNIQAKSRNYKELPLGWKSLIILISEGSKILPLDSNMIVNVENTSIHLSGGLKIGNQEWLLDAPPTLSISSPPKTIVKINDVESFCIIDGADNVELSLLHLMYSNTYVIKANNTSRTIILRNDNVHRINQENFTPVTAQATEGKLKIAGTYIYNNLDEFDNCFEIKNGVAFLTVEGRCYKKPVPQFIKGVPFDLERGFRTLGIEFGKEALPIRKIDLFIEYLSLSGEGNWNNFLRGLSWCFGEEQLRLRAYKVRQRLSQTGFVEFTRKGDTNNYYWRVIPTSAGIIPGVDPLVSIAGARTRRMFETWKNNNSDRFDMLWSIPASDLEPIAVYLYSKSWDDLEEALQSLKIPYNLGDDYFAYHLAKCLPSITSQIDNDKEIIVSNYGNWDVKGWDTVLSKWERNGSSRLKQYTSRFGDNICVLQLPSGNKKKIERDIGKLYLASMEKRKLFSYRNHELRIKKEYTLPELYERALASCIGKCPERVGSYRIYKNVPLEVAWTLVHKLGFELEFLR